MTDGKKEENGRLDFMERIRREAEEERLKAIAEEEKKSIIVEEQKESVIVEEEKRPSHNVDENKFDYYYSAEEEGSSNNRILMGIFGVGIIGLMGYFGFNYFQDDKTPTQNSAIIASDKGKEINSTVSDNPKIASKVNAAYYTTQLKKSYTKNKYNYSSINDIKDFDTALDIAINVNAGIWKDIHSQNLQANRNRAEGYADNFILKNVA